MHSIDPRVRDVIIDEHPSYLKYFHGLAESGLGVKSWKNMENLDVFLSILPMDMKISTKLEGVSAITLEYFSPIYTQETLEDFTEGLY